MARCLRCKAGNEWIEGDVRRASRDGVTLTLTANQATFLRMLLTTHSHVVELGTGVRCKAILKKLHDGDSRSDK